MDQSVGCQLQSRGALHKPSVNLVPRVFLMTMRVSVTLLCTFSYPEPILRAVNGARQGALAKSISNWHLIGYNEGYCSNNVYILLPCFYSIRFWIWPEPLVAPRVRRALGTRMYCVLLRLKNNFSIVTVIIIKELFIVHRRNSALPLYILRKHWLYYKGILKPYCDEHHYNLIIIQNNSVT